MNKPTPDQQMTARAHSIDIVRADIAIYHGLGYPLSRRKVLAKCKLVMIDLEKFGIEFKWFNEQAKGMRKLAIRGLESQLED